jgi:hypothetical protein
MTLEPVVAASVYFDGTSFGVISDEEGKFSIRLSDDFQSPLIISHIGYHLKQIENPWAKTKELRIALVEKAQAIPEVTLTSDPFSRRQKLRVFRKEFLGEDWTAKNCKILNEELVKLYFNTQDSTLAAHANAPLVIENRHLGYLIKFDLIEFQIRFRSKSLDRLGNIKYTSFAGHTQFVDISNDKKRYLRRRAKAYLGSPMHFMRTLWYGDWVNQRFTLFDGVRQVEPGELFVSEGDSSSFKEIRFRTDKFRVYYRRGQLYHSIISINGENRRFRIDKYGVYRPFRNLVIGGDMAEIRMGETLPLNYKYQEAKR